MARLVATMRANPQCESLDTACDLCLVLKAARSEEKNLHDTGIQRGLHEYVDGNVHRVAGHLLTNTVLAVIWDRNKTVTTSAEWPADFAYHMALSLPLPCTVYTNMLTCTLYTLTRPGKLSKDSVSYLSRNFSKYPPDWAQLRARVIEVVVGGMAPSLRSDQLLSIQCVLHCFLMLSLMLQHLLEMMCCMLMWVWTYCVFSRLI